MAALRVSHGRVRGPCVCFLQAAAQRPDQFQITIKVSLGSESRFIYTQTIMSYPELLEQVHAKFPNAGVYSRDTHAHTYTHTWAPQDTYACIFTRPCVVKHAECLSMCLTMCSCCVCVYVYVCVSHT